MEQRGVVNDIRVLFVAQEEMFYSRVFFEKLLDLFPPESVAGVALCPPLGQRSKKQVMKEMYRFCGATDFLRLAWRYARKRAGGEGLEEFLLSRGVPVCRVPDVSGEEFVSLCRKSGPDAIVAVSMPGIFGEEVTRLARLGCLSVRHSPLSGAWDIAENFWRMYHGSASTEIAVYRVNGGREAELILRDEVKIWLDESLDNLLRRMFGLGAGYVVKALDRLRSEAVDPVFNFNAGLPAFGLPGREAVQEFKRRGKRLL